MHKIENFEWIKGSKEAIKYIRDRGYYVFVATNQSGIARGYYTESDVDSLHKFINLELKKMELRLMIFFIHLTIQILKISS